MNADVEFVVKDLSWAEEYILNPLHKLIYSNSIMGTILTEAGSRELKVTVVKQKNTADPVNTFEEAVYRIFSQFDFQLLMAILILLKNQNALFSAIYNYDLILFLV